MTAHALWLLLAFLGVLLAITPPLGAHLARVALGERTFLHPLLAPVERLLYRAAGIDPGREMHWTRYAGAFLAFSLVGTLFLYALLRGQGYLPLNPEHLPNLPPELALNTAVSFATNTNWQSYSGEQAMSYFTQLLGLTWHNFTSAAAGVAIAFVLVRGLARKESATVGNFWADLVRVTLYVLLPISIGVAIFFVSQGVIQNFHGYTHVVTLEGATQLLAQGPVASQEAIKMLGTNGGGFFNANSAHPFENPTPLTNFVQMLLIFSIPSALTFAFGRLVGDVKQGWALWAAMAIVFVGGFLLVAHYEQAGSALLSPNLEGKEVRFGVADSALFATVTTDASCGAVNAMHDSLTPMGGLITLVNIQLGEIIFGGTGSGLYGMIVFALLAVFIAGLMVGRTPEYLGKKLEAREMKLAMLAILVLPFSILLFSAIASVARAGLAGLGNQGPHGFSEILYAFSSATGNNGSAFGGLTATNHFWLNTLSAAMFIGRFLFAVPVLAIGGALAAKKRLPGGAGTLPTTSPLFVGLLVGVILIVGALTFVPALALGPIVEQLAMKASHEGARY